MECIAKQLVVSQDTQLLIAVYLSRVSVTVADSQKLEFDFKAELGCEAVVTTYSVMGNRVLCVLGNEYLLELIIQLHLKNRLEYNLYLLPVPCMGLWCLQDSYLVRGRRG